MSKLLMTEAEIENDALTPEATDEALIDAAKALNEAVRGHLRRSVEDFWRMGEALSHLFRRRHLQGRWADILAEIGISTTTDNHARRLYQSTTLDGLAEFRNKTAALRALGILSKPAPKPSQVSTPEVEGGEEPESPPDHSVQPRTSAPTKKVAPSVDDEAENKCEVGDDSNPPTAGHQPATAPAPSQEDSLRILAMVAARLEDLARTGIDPTPDHLAQFDRAMEALDRLRGKEVADAA